MHHNGDLILAAEEVSLLLMPAASSALRLLYLSSTVSTPLRWVDPDAKENAIGDLCVDRLAVPPLGTITCRDPLLLSLLLLLLRCCPDSD
jgi:hypothetical protein